MVLFGRSEELARIEAVLASGRAGQSAALLIYGDPGIGKTALLDAAREGADAMRVLSARGVPSEAEIPFAGLLELLRPLLDDLSDVPERQAEALRGAFGMSAPVAGDRFLIGAATLSLLASAAEQKPVLVLVDDAHWLDGESLDALLFAVRRFDADAIAILVAARVDALRLESVAGLEALDLHGLDKSGTAELAESIRGSQLNTREAARVFARTRGNPLAVIEIGASDEGLAFDAPAAVSRGVEDAYSRRLHELPADVRSMLLVAAIDDSLDALRVERAVAAIGAMATLADAESSGLIDLDEGRVAFRHPLVRSAVYQSASPAQRRAAHSAVARTLDGQEQAGRRAWHEAAACLAPDERIAAALERAADEARERGGYGAAAVALERAAHLTPDSATRARRLYVAADGAFHAGRADQALRLVNEAVEVCDDPLLRADIENLHGRLLYASGAAGEAYELQLREARRVAGQDHERAARMLSRAASNRIQRGFLEDALRVGREAQQLAREGSDVHDPMVFSTLGHALIFAGQTSEAEALLRECNTTLRERGRLDPVALDMIAVNLLYLGEYQSARAVAQEATDVARSHGALGLLPQVGETLAGAQLVLGAWDSTTGAAAESLRLAYDTHQSQFAIWLCTILADVAAARGRRDDCLALVAEAQALAGGHASWAGHGLVRMALGHLALATGDIAEAISQLELEVDPDVEQASLTLYLPAFDLAEAYVRANRAAEAAVLIERVAPHVHQAWACAALDRCRGLVAAEDVFEEPSRASVATFARLQAPFEEARARLCLGERLRRARRSAEARGELRAALRTFEQLGAEPWAARAHRELEASGETLRRRAPSVVGELTPQELQVARIVAAGATNREAAARLFLSPKTIEAHLHRAYRKLGLTSRAQLRSALGDRETDGDEPR